jgi:hypothetical protein
MNEVYHQMTLDEWDKIVEETKWHLNNIANSFIIIGYNLKKIRDEEAYRLKGYNSMSEFAEKELHISKSTVTRAIQINEKYANGKMIKQEYTGYGRQLLEAMLGLSPEEEALITPQTSREEVRELKRFSKNEPEETIGIEKAIIRFLAEDEEVFWDLLDEEELEEKVDILNPSGNRTYKAGDIYLWLYDINKGVKYRIFGQTQTEELTWEEFFDLVEDLEEKINREIEKKSEPQKESELKQTSQKPDLEEPKKEEEKTKNPAETSKLEIPEPKIGKNEPKNEENQTPEEPASLSDYGEKVVPAQLEEKLEIPEAKMPEIETETVFEKLKKKNLEQMAEWLTGIGCPPGKQYLDRNTKCEACKECWMLYLNQYEAAEL